MTEATSYDPGVLWPVLFLGVVVLSLMALHHLFRK